MYSCAGPAQGHAVADDPPGGAGSPGGAATVNGGHINLQET